MQAAKIVPPTSQNQKTIENDLWHFVPTVLDLPKDELTWQCEQAIRNYDPCISCATHFLKVRACPGVSASSGSGAHSRRGVWGASPPGSEEAGHRLASSGSHSPRRPDYGAIER